MGTSYWRDLRKMYGDESGLDDIKVEDAGAGSERLEARYV